MKNYSETIKNAPLLNTEGLHRDLGKVMVIAPHPDDESLGCGGLIAHLTAQNSEVLVLFMTNGEASHPNSHKSPPKLLGDLRKKEAIQACEILGVEKDHLIFLDAGDGLLAKYLKEDESVIGKLKDIFEEYNPETIFAPWRRDHHTDHLATSELVRRASDSSKAELVEYPVWLWKKGQPADWPQKEEILPFRLSVETVKEQKREAIEAHLSQTTKLIDDDPEGFVLTSELLEPFLEDYEYFFFPANSKPGVKESYFDELYSDSSDPWNFETSEYEQNKYKDTLNAIPQGHFNNALEIGCSNGVFTAMFAPQCDNLLAIDLNKKALETARKRCLEFSQCKFREWDISNGLPDNNYDIIILSEVGYYFEKEQLKIIFQDIVNGLSTGGILVMVHWTAYVRSYPLTGLQVHQIFRDHYSDSFHILKNQREELYELEVWEKVAK